MAFKKLQNYSMSPDAQNDVGYGSINYDREPENSLSLSGKRNLDPFSLAGNDKKIAMDNQLGQLGNSFDDAKYTPNAEKEQIDPDVAMVMNKLKSSPDLVNANEDSRLAQMYNPGNTDNIPKKQEGSSFDLSKAVQAFAKPKEGHQEDPRQKILDSYRPQQMIGVHNSLGTDSQFEPAKYTAYNKLTKKYQ